MHKGEMKRNKFQDDKLIEHLISIPNCPDWLCFFVMFSRFEYALKRTRYIPSGKKYAEADWKTFGEKVESEFNKQKCQELTESIKYLEENPPKRQIVKDGRLDWADLDYRDYKDKEIQRLICAIKQVRNNLFHGGKYHSGPVTDPSRDRDLIKHSITVLRCLIYSSAKVKKVYSEKL